MFPGAEEEDERRGLMRERKTVVLPVEVLDDPRLTLSDIGLLGEILRNQFQFSKITTANLKSVLKETEKTIRKGLVRLTESGYLIKDSRNNGWLIDFRKIYGNERENLPEQTVKSPETNGKISLCKKEEESTKEEDKNIKQEYIYNNIILKEAENEKEREKKREKNPAEGLTSTIENRGVHGDSSFMLDGIPPSSENPSAMADGSAKEIQERAEEAPEPEKPTEAEKPERFTAEYREIIGYLNEKTGKRFSATSRVNQGHMSARLKEGFTVEDFKHVIDVKCFQWKDDAKMAKFLRPETLFGTKFDRYLNEEFKVTRKGPNGWEYTVTDEPDELDLIFGGGKHG